MPAAGGLDQLLGDVHGAVQQIDALAGQADQLSPAQAGPRAQEHEQPVPESHRAGQRLHLGQGWAAVVPASVRR